MVTLSACITAESTDHKFMQYTYMTLRSPMITSPIQKLILGFEKDLVECIDMIWMSFEEDVNKCLFHIMHKLDNTKREKHI